MAIRVCPHCNGVIPEEVIVCPHCRRDLFPIAATPAVDPHPGSIPIDPSYGREQAVGPIGRVTVVDINMPFASMVGFMIKWSLAAIPAFLILAVIGAIIAAAFAGLVAGGMGARSTARAGAAQTGRSLGRASALRGLTYPQVLEALGQPTSQRTGVLYYKLANGNELEVQLVNSRVSTVTPSEFDLSAIVPVR